MVSIQANMQVHDDLAALFSRNMTFNPEIPREEPVPEPAISQPIAYSISQHYHHSAHIAKPDSQRHSSEPPQSEVTPSEVLLRNHGVDPATLTPSQLQLFRVADTPQRRRLIELWSICPPSSGGDIPALAWSSTTVEQEEHLARMRYERQQNQVMSLDGTPVQTADSRWVHHASNDSEPYMLSGYEELMRREQEQQSMDSRPRDAYSHFGTSVGGPACTHATDPVYLGPDYARHQLQLALAEQYGAFQQIRGSGAVDVMDM